VKPGPPGPPGGPRDPEGPAGPVDPLAPGPPGKPAPPVRKQTGSSVNSKPLTFMRSQLHQILTDFHNSFTSHIGATAKRKIY